MLDNILGITTGASLTDLGILAAITTVVVQVLKQIVSKDFPTKALTVIVSMVLSFSASLVCYGYTLKTLLVGVVIGFLTAFVAMNGFDSLKSIWDRFNPNKPEEIEVDTEEPSEDGGEG